MLSVTGDNSSTYAVNQSAAGYWQGAVPCYGNLRLLVVGVISVSADPTGMTYNGVALTKLAAAGSPGSTYSTRATLWTLPNPTQGSNSLRATWSGTFSARLVVASFFNVHAYTPLSAPKTYGGNILTTTLTFPDSVNQGYSFHIGGFGGAATRTLGTGETSLYNNGDTYGATVISGMCGVKATTGANATLSMSSNLARDFAHVGVAILPFPGGRTFQIVNGS